jgi:NAD(P)-dependent dehydrogenase (short-subunit alcohol dehydrogenase family)
MLRSAMQYSLDRTGMSEEQMRGMLTTMMVPVGRISEPSEVAGVIRFLLSAEARYMTGGTVVADGGMSA